MTKKKILILILGGVIVLALSFAIGIKIAMGISNFFDTRYLQRNRIAELILKWPLTIKDKEPEYLVIGRQEDIVEEVDYNLDELVSTYADKYGSTTSQKSLLRARLHCLLYKESKHNNDLGDGDKGNASGPLQFWKGTYLRMRTQMMDKGLADHMGSRYDAEDAIETAAWATLEGYKDEWGPISRNECF